MSTAVHTDVRRSVTTSRLYRDSAHCFSDFAVGFSRQPLPKGKCFASLTKAEGSCIMATDAAACYGFELAKLRPEKLETRLAKLPPTATFFPVTTAISRHVFEQFHAEGSPCWVRKNHKRGETAAARYVAPRRGNKTIPTLAGLEAKLANGGA